MSDPILLAPRLLVAAVLGLAPVVHADDAQMTEYYYAPLNYYFITSQAANKILLDGIDGWSRTGKSFTVSTNQQAGTVALSRFYFDRVARNESRGSHFFTAQDSERAALHALNPANTPAPRLPYDEGEDSYVLPALVTGRGGSCASGLTPVFRAFRGNVRFPDDPNHRFSTELAVHNSMVASGWDDEGVQFCAKTAAPSSSGKVIGISGVSSWDALAAAERQRIKTTVQSFFLHQSVGGDLEDGAQSNGFKFEYADSTSPSLAAGLNGGLFFSSNGNASGKINEFRTMALAHRTTLSVAIMKFGYADITAETMSDAKNAYLAAVSSIKAAGIRMLHVSPPLTYNTPPENLVRIQMREWMISSFPDDVVFDLQDLESTAPGTGARCVRGGVWEICDAVRSTSTCPSLNQGIDNPSGGQGHVCFNPHAITISKALLYSIYLASR